MALYNYVRISIIYHARRVTPLAAGSKPGVDFHHVTLRQIAAARWLGGRQNCAPTR